MAFDITNYYEALVRAAVERHAASHLTRTDTETRDETMQDAACIALNRLPARYIRHQVDAHFYLGAEEQQAMKEAVDAAVRDAFAYLDGHPAARDGGEASPGLSPSPLVLTHSPKDSPP